MAPSLFVRSYWSAQHNHGKAVSSRHGRVIYPHLPYVCVCREAIQNVGGGIYAGRSPREHPICRQARLAQDLAATLQGACPLLSLS